MKKKLKKLQQNGAEPEHEPGSSSTSHSISRGQWERRLQADIHTAKQALHDALSFETTTEPAAALPPCKKPGNPFPYASSTENIARLLKQWVKTTPKSEDSSKCSSSTDQNSLSNTCGNSKSGIDLSEAFESLFGFEGFENSNCDEVSRSASPSIVKPDPDALLAPFSILENWLLDDQGKDYLTNFSFDENQDLF